MTVDIIRGTTGTHVSQMPERISNSIQRALRTCLGECDNVRTRLGVGHQLLMTCFRSKTRPCPRGISGNTTSSRYFYQQ